MKKKILGLICGILLMGLVTGCGNNDSGLNDDNVNKKGNCVPIECIKKINPEHTVEQINEIMGFTGELVDEKYNKYYWGITEDTGVEVSYYSSSKGQIEIDYDRDSLANNKVNFSKYEELKPKIKEGISYKYFISYIGNVEGTIIEKSSSSTKYVWVDKNGGYLQGTFSNNSGNCTFVSGRF